MADEELPLYIPAPALADYFSCPVCMAQIADCYMTTCGHRFCGKCIKESVDVHHRCPCCNSTLNSENLIKDRLFDDMIGKFNKEKTRAEKSYFSNLIDQAHVQDDLKTFTDIEVVLKDHLKRSLTAHQNYYQSIQKAYHRNCALLKEKHSERLEHLQGEGLTQTELEKESNILQERLAQEQNELAKEFETSTKLIAKAYDRYLNEHIPNLSILPIRVSITLLQKNVQLKLIEVKPLDTIDDIKKRIEISMEKRGDKIIKFGSDVKFIDFGLFSRRTYDEMCKIAEQVTTPEDCPEGVTLILQNARPVIELHVKSGSEVAVSGTVFCESDLPKNCFAATFQPGQNEAIDYFTCKDCGFNWVCRPCYEVCHKAHTCVPYIMEHRPTWPCCYCPKKKKCCIQPDQTDRLSFLKHYTNMSVSREFPRVKEVRSYTVKGQDDDQGADCHDVNDDHWINGWPTPIANPMSIYPQYAATRKSWGINALGSMVVEVEATDGTIGVGVSIGGEPGCHLVENHLSRFVEGQDARDIELMWEQMFRSSLNYGRKGLTMQAISAVDLALWDLLGKLRREPVYALLGGKTKDRLPVYSTTARPDLAKDLGFVAAKVPCPYGPAEGDQGLAKNVEFFKKWRNKVGRDFPLMLDCYMALTVPYTIKLVKALQPYNLKWIEEFLPPDNYDGYVQVRNSLQDSGILLTTGEHEYSRYGFQQLLKTRCVDIIQPDITWMGGITEARRVVAMAAAQDILVIPHGSSVYSYHLQYAFTNCPVAEFINLSPKADKITPYFGGLFPDEPLPAKGFIDLPNRPGFGVTLNRENLHRPHPRDAKHSQMQATRNTMCELPTNAVMPI